MTLKFKYDDKFYYLAESDNAYEWFREAADHGGPITPFFLFWFGAVGSTPVVVFNDSLDDALEEAAALLLDEGMVGHIMPYGSAELQELYDEAAEDLPEDASEEEVREAAEADLTYTESGFLTSYEWGVNDLLAPDPILGKAFKAAVVWDRADNAEYIAEFIDEENMSPSMVFKAFASLGVSEKDQKEIWNVVSDYFGDDYVSEWHRREGAGDLLSSLRTG
jgi:hypothetical protein